MKTNWGRRRMMLVIAGIVLMLLGPTTTASAQSGPTMTRPIADFLSTQGTLCIDDGMGGCLRFVPPVRNYIGWVSALANPPVRFASMDYAGLADAYLQSQGAPSLGTTMAGTVRERPLRDGRAEVKVNLHTKNALSWANDCCDFAAGVLLFGSRATDVLAGSAPALGECFLDFVFINTAPGAPLPDLLQVAFLPEPGQELRTLAFRGTASGPLHAAFGVVEGTPGRLVITQTGIFFTSFQGATADGFPAERVDLHALAPGAGGPGDLGQRAGNPTPLTDRLAMAPNPLRQGQTASFAYRVPEGGADVRIGVYSVSGRRLAELARGFQPAGTYTARWDGRDAVGAAVGSGVYFIRTTVGERTFNSRLLFVK